MISFEEIELVKDLVFASSKQYLLQTLGNDQLGKFRFWQEFTRSFPQTSSEELLPLQTIYLKGMSARISWEHYVDAQRLFGRMFDVCWSSLMFAVNANPGEYNDESIANIKVSLKEEFRGCSILSTAPKESFQQHSFVMTFVRAIADLRICRAAIYDGVYLDLGFTHPAILALPPMVKKAILSSSI